MTENRRLCWHWGTGEEPTHAELFQGDPAEANDSVLYHGANWSMTDEHKALIAAAPDLLAALDHMTNLFRVAVDVREERDGKEFPADRRQIAAARAVIAKARGE